MQIFRVRKHAGPARTSKAHDRTDRQNSLEVFAALLFVVTTCRGLVWCGAPLLPGGAVSRVDLPLTVRESAPVEGEHVGGQTAALGVPAFLGLAVSFTASRLSPRPVRRGFGRVCRAAGGSQEPAVSTVGVYESTWSNPSGQVLTPLVSGSLWAAERPFVWNGIDVGGKMAVVRLPSGGLWVHSPVDLDDRLRTALAALGPVKHIVAPNFEHVKWARQWKEAFPSARLWGSPGMKEKFPDIPYDFELDRSGKAPAEWEEAFDAAFFDCESIPFTSIPFFNEVIFHHRATRTLICTDTYWNYPSGGIPGQTALWKWGMDKVYLPVYKGLMVRDTAALESALDRVAEWAPEALLPCHGVYQASGATAMFLQHLQP